MNRPTTTAHWVRGTLEHLALLGLDSAHLRHVAGIDKADLDHPDALRLPSDALSVIWSEALRLSGNPELAVQQASVQPSNFEVVGYAMMSCPTFAQALQRLLRYTRVVSEVAHTELHREGEECRLVFTMDGDMALIPRQRYEYTMLVFLNFCRWLVGPTLQPLRIDFAAARPDDIASHERAFGCPLRFGAASHGIVFMAQDLQRPLRTSNPELAEMHERFAARALARLASSSVEARTREIITLLLPEGEPRREQVAERLRMSERTLQRRLRDEGTSFLHLLDATRRELAQTYLQAPELAVSEVAYLLGFADQSNLHRACKRWFGHAPSRLRQET